MNEDRVAEVALGDTPQWGAGVLVADGMGGAAGGERASRLVAETLVGRLLDWQSDPSRLGPRFAAAATKHLTEIVDGIHSRIRAEAASDPGLDGMGSTLTLVAVTASVFLVLHVGDSRAYLLRRGQLSQLTKDHSDGDGGPLLQVLGGNLPIEPEVLTGPIEPGDLFIVCSDGLTKHLRDEEIRAVASEGNSVEDIAEALTMEANRRGGRDNIGIGLVRVPSSGKRGAPPAGSRRAGQRRSVLVPLLLAFGGLLCAGAAAAAYFAWTGALGGTSRLNGSGAMAAAIPTGAAPNAGAAPVARSTDTPRVSDRDVPPARTNGSAPRGDAPPDHPTSSRPNPQSAPAAAAGSGSVQSATRGSGGADTSVGSHVDSHASNDRTEVKTTKDPGVVSTPVIVSGAAAATNRSPAGATRDPGLRPAGDSAASVPPRSGSGTVPPSNAGQRAEPPASAVSPERGTARSATGAPPQTAQHLPPSQSKAVTPRDSCADQRQALVELKSELKAMPDQLSDSLFRTNQREDSALRAMKRNSRTDHEISAMKNRFEHHKQDLADSFKVRLESVERRIAAAEAATKSRICKPPKGK